jgi:hypothetical protein
VSLPRALSAVCVVLALVTAGGCGGDGGGSENSSSKTLDDWTSTVCGGLGDWSKSLQAGSQALGPALQKTKNLENVKKSFITFLEDAEKDARTLVGEVKSAGPPEADDGEAFQREFVSVLEKMQRSFARAVDRAEELPTGGLQSFRSGVGGVSTDVEKNLQATGAFYNDIGERWPEIKEAIDSNPRCDQFANAG